MGRTNWNAITVGCLMVVLAWLALRSGVTAEDHAVNPTARAALDFPIATIDLQKVLEAHPQFIADKAQLAADVKRIEEELKKRRSEIGRIEEELMKLKPDSEEYKQLVRKLTEEKTQFNEDATVQKSKLEGRETSIYEAAFEDIAKHVKQYGDAHQLRLILKSRKSLAGWCGTPPQEATKAIDYLKNDIVYQNGIDITGAIIKLVKDNAAPEAVDKDK